MPTKPPSCHIAAPGTRAMKRYPGCGDSLPDRIQTVGTLGSRVLAGSLNVHAAPGGKRGLQPCSARTAARPVASGHSPLASYWMLIGAPRYGADDVAARRAWSARRTS